MSAGRAAENSAIIDRYLSELDGCLVVPRRYRRRVLAEVADHLIEVAEANQAGTGTDNSIADAVRRFGAADRLAAEINAGWASARARRAPGFAFLAGAGVLAGAMAGLPARAASGPAGQATVAVVATVALLALQLAVVAGAVAALKVLARRSSPLLAPSDRMLAWRAARLSVAATAVAGAGLLGVATLQAHQSGNGADRVVAAALGMLAVLVLTASAIRRPRPATEPGPGGLSADPAAGFEAMGGAGGAVERLARLAERAVALTRRWPGPATALLAGFCAAGSYAHAESTRPASLLAAAVEATAVVVFARVFGPTLELREGPSSDLSPSPIDRD